MSDEDLSPESEVQALVADYIAIVQQHGPGSDQARRFRDDHAGCPGLDDVDAAYEVAETEDKRRRVRGCLISFILIFAAGIAALGIIFASKAGWLGHEFETAVTKAEEVAKTKVEEVFAEKLKKTEEDFDQKLKTTESSFTEKLVVAEENRVQAERKLATTNAIADELSRINHTLSLPPDPPIDVTPPDEPNPPMPEDVDLLGELSGLPRRIVGTGDETKVAVDLTEPVFDPRGATVKLESSNPGVLWFQVFEQPVTSIHLMTGDEQLRFEIVAEEVETPQAVLLTLQDGEQRRHAAILVAPPDPLDSPVESIVLPSEPVIGGARFVALLRLRADVTDEEIDRISLQADGVQFERPEMEPGSTTLGFPGTVAGVTEPTIVRVTARISEGDDSRDLTSCFLVLPQAGKKSGLASLRIAGRAGEPWRWARVKFAGPRAEYPRVVFLKSSDRSVRVPSLVIVKPNKITADFLVRAAGANGVRSVVITASYEGDSKQVKLESDIKATICLPQISVPTLIQP